MTRADTGGPDTSRTPATLIRKNVCLFTPTHSLFILVDSFFRGGFVRVLMGLFCRPKYRYRVEAGATSCTLPRAHQKHTNSSKLDNFSTMGSIEDALADKLTGITEYTSHSEEI